METDKAWESRTRRDSENTLLAHDRGLYLLREFSM